METILYNSRQIEQAVLRIADVVNKNCINRDDVVLMPILQGAVPLFVDVCKHLDFNPFVEYIGISSYEQQQQKQFNLYKFVDPNAVQNKSVWLFDDIADSGNTLNFLKTTLLQMGAKEVHTCVLLKKRTCPFEVDVAGFIMGDEWVWGYGMDAPDGRGRILDEIMCK
jgi:hypoxanthine phosphoribosyltransferase